MSLKSIKKNYIKLLEAFSEAGVTLNESQKETMDTFVSDFEETLKEKEKEVEERISNEYKQVVENILNHQKEHAELTGKIQDKVTSEKESQKIAEAVDSYLSKYVEEILPNKTIVDYARMEKLERIQESLKEMLVISEANINDKTTEITEDLTKKNEETTKKLDECEEKIKEQEKELSSLKAEKFINEKTKDLPEIESDKVKEKTQGMGLDEVTEKYDSILESVQKEIADEKVVTEDDTKSLEEAITEILEKNETEASTEKISGKEVEGQEINPPIEDDEEPSELVSITESQMQAWINTLNRITPKK